MIPKFVSELRNLNHTKFNSLVAGRSRQQYVLRRQFKRRRERERWTGHRPGVRQHELCAGLRTGDRDLASLGRRSDGGVTLTGNEFNNSLTGGSGNDTLSGSAGNDKLSGGSGNDKLIGGVGADTLTGGLGTDTFFYQSIGESTVATTGRDTIADFSSAQGDKIDAAAIFDSKQVGQDTVITVDPNDTVTLQGTAMSSLTQSSFKFV
jgi:Ca2+-binding RTX toxin-like protein